MAAPRLEPTLLRLFPRSPLLARLEALLQRTAARLDALDPPRGEQPGRDEPRPVLRALRPAARPSRSLDPWPLPTVL